MERIPKQAGAELTSDIYRNFVSAHSVKSEIYDDAKFCVAHLEGQVARDAEISQPNHRFSVKALGKGDEKRNVTSMLFGTTTNAKQMADFLNNFRLRGGDGKFAIKFFADKSGKFLCLMGNPEIGDFYKDVIGYARAFEEALVEMEGAESPAETARKTVVLNRPDHPRVNGAVVIMVLVAKGHRTDSHKIGAQCK